MGILATQNVAHIVDGDGHKLWVKPLIRAGSGDPAPLKTKSYKISC